MSLLTLKIQIAVVKHQACLNRVNFEMGWGGRWVGGGDGLEKGHGLGGTEGLGGTWV